MMLKRTVFRIIISLCFFNAHVTECGSSSSWQACSDKCYYLGQNKMNFGSQAGYCSTMSGSVPVDFGVKMAMSIATFFLPCRISKIDDEPYWINRRSVLCRTITFEGDDVLMNQEENCTSLSYPICQKDKSYCNAANDSGKLNHNWIRVGGKGPYFMLSQNPYPYCEARRLCQYSWSCQISPGGNYSFMGNIGTELGITGQRNVEFWLDSPGVSCPAGQSDGTVMQYTGPFVHLSGNKNAQLHFPVLCMKDNLDTQETTTSTIQITHTSLTSTQNSTTSTTSTTQQTHSSSTSTQAPTSSTAQQTHSSSTSTQVPTSSTAQQTHSSSTSTQAPTSSTAQQTHSLSTNTKTPTALTSQSTHTSFTSTQAPTTQQTLSSATSSRNPTTSSTQRTSTSSTSTQNRTSLTAQIVHTSFTSTQAPTNSKTQQTLASTKTQTTMTSKQAQTSSTNTKTPMTKSTRETHTSSTNTLIPTTTITQKVHTSSTLIQIAKISTKQQTHTSSANTKNPTTWTTQQAHTPSKITQITLIPKNSHTNAKRTKSPTIKSTQQTRIELTSTQKMTNSTKQQTQTSSMIAKPSTTKRTHQTQTVQTSTQFPTTKSTQRIHTSSASTQDTESKRWIQIGQEEYYVNTVPLDYIKASKFCREKMNASLVMFLDPLNYFSVLGQIPQVASQKKSFWIGAFGMEKGMFTDECLSYNNDNMTLTTLSCHYEKFSVCRRILKGNLSKVLETPEFKTMIREMTVLRNVTKSRLRKLTCATDRRPSSKAAGGVGVFIICSVIVVMLMNDCSSIKSSFFNKKDKLR